MININKSRDERLEDEMRLKWALDIDMENLKSGVLKETHPRIYKHFMDRIQEIENNLGAEINASKDFTDNHKYNYLREKLWTKKNSINAANVEK